VRFTTPGAGAGFALYSCDSPTDAAAQAAGAEAAAGRYYDGVLSFTCKIRGPNGWVDYVFHKSELGSVDWIKGKR
jgi:hypothetical protein